MVEPSEEIRRVIQRWMSAMADDDDSALRRLSDHPGDAHDRHRPGRVVARARRSAPSGARHAGGASGRPVRRGRASTPGRKAPIEVGERSTEVWSRWAAARAICESRATYVLPPSNAAEWKIVHSALVLRRSATRRRGLRRGNVDRHGSSDPASRTAPACNVERPDLSNTLAADGTVDDRLSRGASWEELDCLDRPSRRPRLARSSCVGTTP